MTKVLKIIGIIIGLLAVLIIGAAIIIPQVVDPNDYRATIEEQVQAKTGRSFKLNGPMEVSVFPWLGVEVNDFALSNAKGFEPANMLSGSVAQVRVAIWPLLSRQVVVDTVVLRNVQINLATNARGVTNWDDLLAAAQAAPKAPQPDEPTPPAPTQTGQMPAMSISGVDIENAQLTYVDGKTGATHAVQNLNVEVDAFELGRPIPVKTSFTATSTAPQTHADVEADVEVFVDAASAMFKADIEDFVVKLREFTPANVQGKDPLAATLELAGSLESAWQQGTASAKGLKLTLDASGGPIPGDAVTASFSGDANVDWRQQVAKLANFSLAVLDAKMNGTVQASKFLSTPQLSGTVELSPFNPRQLARQMGMALPPLKDETVLTKAGGTMTFSGTPQELSTKDLSFTLDDSTLTGSASASQFDKPRLRFDLNVDQLNVDRYMPAQADTSEPEQQSPETTEQTPEKQPKGDPYAPLRSLDAKGTMRVGELTAFKIPAQDVLVTVNAQNGRIVLDPLNAGLFGGLVKTGLTADVRGDTPATALRMDVSSLRMGELLNTVAGTDVLQGDTFLNLDVTTKGTTLWTILRNLDGSLSFDLKDGMVKGFRLEPVKPKEIEAAKNEQGQIPLDQLTGAKQSATSGEPPMTKLQNVSASFDIRDGIAKAQKATIKTPFNDATVSGQADLAEQKLDMMLDFNMKVMTVPISIGGTFTDPKIGFDMAALPQRIVEDVIKVPGKVLQAPLDVGRAIGDLFGSGKNKETTEEPAQ